MRLCLEKKARSREITYFQGAPAPARSQHISGKSMANIIIQILAPRGAFPRTMENSNFAE